MIPVIISSNLLFKILNDPGCRNHVEKVLADKEVAVTMAASRFRSIPAAYSSVACFGSPCFLLLQSCYLLLGPLPTPSPLQPLSLSLSLGQNSVSLISVDNVMAVAPELAITC